MNAPLSLHMLAAALGCTLLLGCPIPETTPKMVKVDKQHVDQADETQQPTEKDRDHEPKEKPPTEKPADDSADKKPAPTPH